MSFICEFCSTPLSSKTNLKAHQLKTKKCLEIQKLKGSEIKENEFLCEFCDKSFLYKGTFFRHQTICHERSKQLDIDNQIQKIRNEYKVEIDDYKKQIEQLIKDKQEMKHEHEKEIEKLKYSLEKEKSQSLIGLLQEQSKEIIKTTLAPKPSTVNNNYNTTNNIQMNVLNLSSERIRPAVDSYTIEHYLKGAEGMVEWIVEKVLTDEDGQFLYVCTDKNRKHFFFLNENKEKVEDIKAQKLLAAIAPEISDKLKECKKTRNEEIVEKFFGETQAHDDKIMSEKKKNKKLYDEALGSKMLNKLVERIYN